MSRTRSSIIRLSTILAAVTLGWAILVWLNGGVNVSVAGTRITSNNVWRPLLVGVVAAAVALALQGVRRAISSIVERVERVSPTRCAILIAIVTTAVSARYNSWTASGPDSFAYVSQAALWRNGHLEIPVPLAARAPWPEAVNTFVPFGYRPAPGGLPAVVPITAPGVPLVMALFQSVAGHAAAFLVTPVAGGALVLLTFAIGRRVEGPVVGVIAAWLVATSPAVLFMLMWPMTDVPAAAVTALMLWLLLSRTTFSAVAAGLSGAAAVLTRPNMVAVVGCAFLWLIVDAWLWTDDRGRRRWRRPIGFAAGVLPGILAMAAVNARWYGSPWASGYGTASGLLSLNLIVSNAARYTRWIWESSPLALVGAAAIGSSLVRRSSPSARRAAGLFALTVLGTCSLYLVYGDFTDWWYLRFLLPAWPALFVPAAILLRNARRRGRAAAIAIVAIVLGAGVQGVLTAKSRGVFGLGNVERRYATVARLVADATEPTAVILTCQHVGTVRYYGGRETLRFDQLDPAWLDRAVAWLLENGHRPYILVEDWELPQFESRFARDNAFGRLSYSPLLAWQSSTIPGWIYLYDPKRRDAVTLHPGAEVEQGQPVSALPTGIQPPR